MGWKTRMFKLLLSRLTSQKANKLIERRSVLAEHKLPYSGRHEARAQYCVTVVYFHRIFVRFLTLTYALVYLVCLFNYVQAFQTAQQA